DRPREPARRGAARVAPGGSVPGAGASDHQPNAERHAFAVICFTVYSTSDALREGIPRISSRVPSLAVAASDSNSGRGSTPTRSAAQRRTIRPTRESDAGPREIVVNGLRRIRE